MSYGNVSPRARAGSAQSRNFTLPFKLYFKIKGFLQLPLWPLLCLSGFSGTGIADPLGLLNVLFQEVAQVSPVAPQTLLSIRLKEMSRVR